MQRQRLKTLERATAHLPSSGAELLRRAHELDGTAFIQWMATLSDVELESLGRALEAERWAAGLPVYDLSVLTNEELERVSAGDESLLAKCQLLPPTQEMTR